MHASGREAYFALAIEGPLSSRLANPLPVQTTHIVKPRSVTTRIAVAVGSASNHRNPYKAVIGSSILCPVWRRRATSLSGDYGRIAAERDRSRQQRACARQSRRFTRWPARECPARTSRTGTL